MIDSGGMTILGVRCWISGGTGARLFNGILALLLQAELRGADPRPVLVVAMITTPPMSFRWRRMIRKYLPEITMGVAAVGRDVEMVVRFAVGGPPQEMRPRLKPQLRAMLAAEQEYHRDLAVLNMTDGSCNDGKTWYTFEWAAKHFPEAELVFKLDDDTVVDWRVAMPQMLGRLFDGPPVEPLRRLYIGTLAAAYSCPGVLDGRAPCAAGALYGFSGDIVQWVAENAGPVQGLEDMEACAWARSFEREVLQEGEVLDPRGLLEALRGEIGGAWVHPVKDRQHYEKCYEDREHGCYALMFPNSWYPALLHFWMPPS